MLRGLSACATRPPRRALDHWLANAGRLTSVCEQLERRYLLCATADHMPSDADDLTESPADCIDDHGEDCGDDALHSADQNAAELVRSNVPQSTTFNATDEATGSPNRSSQRIGSAVSRWEISRRNMEREFLQIVPRIAMQAPSLPLHHRIWVSPPPTPADSIVKADSELGSDDAALEEFWRELGLALKEERHEVFHLGEFLSNPLPSAENESTIQKLRQSIGPNQPGDTNSDAAPDRNSIRPAGFERGADLPNKRPERADGLDATPQTPEQPAKIEDAESLR